MIPPFRTLRTPLAAAALALLCIAAPLRAQTAAATPACDNPLIAPSDAPFGAPRFDRIHAADFPPALAEGLREYEARIDSIRAVAPEAATFENVVEALDRASRKLYGTQTLLGYLKNVVGGDSLVRAYEMTAPAISEAYDRATFDPKIFALVSTLHTKRETLGLDTLARLTLERCYNSFVARGALRPAEEQRRLSEINTQLALRRTRHGQNIIRATDNFVLFVRDSNRLTGISRSLRQRMARRAWEMNRPWEWAIAAADYSGVMATAADRSLREELYKAYTTRCSAGGEYDNRALTAEILNLRLEWARLMGYDTYAEPAVRGNMARTPQRVRELLLPLIRATNAEVAGQIEQMHELLRRDAGADTPIEPWDLSYYHRRLHAERFGSELQQVGYYLQPDRVREGMFQVARRLYGITMHPRTDIPVCHPDIEVFEARNRDGTALGLLYLDCYARKGKMQGASTGLLRRYATDGTREELPLVTIACNFARAPRGRIQLMSLSQVKTLFHEFGHALARLLARGPYQQVTGAYPKDMVELPSQLMEHWAWEPEAMKSYTSHYRTGKPMPRALIDRVREDRNTGKTLELLASCFTALLDLQLHSLTAPTDPEGIDTLVAELRRRYDIPESLPIIDPTLLNHLFAGSYGAKFYAYVWASVLDTDAYAAFTETGDPYDPAVAERFRRHILTQIGYDRPEKQYVRFRGRMPRPEALLERYGLTLPDAEPEGPEKPEPSATPASGAQ